MSENDDFHGFVEEDNNENDAEYLGDKETIRQVLFNKRKEVSEEEVMYASEEICHRLWELIRDLNSKVISLYVPMNNEVDISQLADRLESHGATLCLPQVKTKGEPLVFNEWVPSEDLMVSDVMGIPCVEGEEVTPDLVLIPTLCFDNYGNRIGYGAGYYDMTLPEFPKAIRVAVAYAFQQVEQLEAEDHDVPMHYIATDAELIEAK